MATIREIVPGERFLEVIVEGVALRGFPNLEKFLREIHVICQKHRCYQVLLNCAEVDYDFDSDVLAEHRFAEILSHDPSRAIRWALIVPPTAKSDTFHFVNAARNRGVQILAFFDREEAIAWLESTPPARET